MTSSIKASDLINELEKRHWKQKETKETKEVKASKEAKVTKASNVVISQNEVVSPHEQNSSTSAFLITLGLALGSGLYAWTGWMGVIGALLMIAGCLYIMKI